MLLVLLLLLELAVAPVAAAIQDHGSVAPLETVSKTQPLYLRAIFEVLRI